MTSKQVNGVVEEQGSMKLLKKLFGIPNERGGTNWLDECPDYLKDDSSIPDHALVSRYKEARAGAKRALNLDSIEIHSPYLRQALRHVFRSYPGQTVDQDELTFEAPFEPFFHQWATLHNICQKADGEQRQQLEALLEVLKEQLGPDIRDSQSMARNGTITFRLLWTLFPPGTPVFGIWKGQWHCFLVNEARYLKAELVPMLVMELLALDHDGDRYGWTKVNKYISSFDGSAKITGLDAIPIHFYKDAPELLQILYERGSRTADLLNRQPVYQTHEGAIRLHTVFDGDEIEVFVEGRTIIDPKSHAQHANRYCPAVSTIPHKLESLLTRDADTKTVTGAEDGRQTHDLLSVIDNLNQHLVLSRGPSRPEVLSLTKKGDRSALKRHEWTEAIFKLRPETFCRSAVRGYDLTTKAWAEFEINNLSDIKWNKDAFEALVIPPARKRILEALVKQQQAHKSDADFDDVVQGKGQGLIMLLTGPPGTGKTLTAESIADRLHLPLYAVSANELGDNAKEIELQFGQVLRLAANWNAVLLLDEADAFLERRLPTPESRDRNKRVAAFLRILEYYKGILILTTNRIVDFDDAFYSRIHLNLPFNALDQTSRENIWKNFLRGAKIPDQDISRFASEELNGRQIKNIMKMARLLAKDGEEPMGSHHVQDVLDVVRQDSEQLSKAVRDPLE